MKKILLLLCIASSFLACDISGEKDEIKAGEKWKLIETRVSMGGPAEYVPAETEEYIEFLTDSKVRKSNGWCGEGRETIVTYSEDGTIHTNCNNSGTRIFKFEGGFLILRNPNCIEACDYKYARVGK